MIQINDYCHINLNFENGVRVSVNYGPGMHGSNYDAPSGAHLYGSVDREKLQKDGALTAEVAIIYKDQFITSRFVFDDDIICYVGADKLIDICKWAKELSKQELDHSIQEEKL